MATKYSSAGEIRGAISKVLREPAFWAGVAPVGLGMGAGAAHNAITRLRDTKERAQAYREMMELHPRLKQQDPNKIKRYYGSLSRFNPTMAKDPTVAGAWMTNIMETESELGEDSGAQALLTSIKDLAGIRSHMSGAMDRERGGSTVGRQVQDISQGLLRGVADAKREHLEGRLEAQQYLQDQMLREMADGMGAKEVGERLARIKERVELHQVKKDLGLR